VIDLRRDDDVFILRLDEGENRFNRDTVGTIHEALDEVEASAGPAALVTTGSGKYYSNWLDLDWLSGPGAGSAAAAVMVEVHRLFARVLGLPMPTVAAVNGHAFAAGAMLAVAHDIRIMRMDRGYWCLPEVDLGLPLTPGMSALVTARLPRLTAHEAIVTGRRYGGAQAHEHAVVNEAVPDWEVLPRAVARARELAAKRGEVMGQLKREMYGPVLALLDPAG
jgi:enoyl-CoA hydratase/carnithine racemase